MPDNVVQQHIAHPDTTDTVAPVDTSQLYHAPLYSDGFPMLSAADSAAPSLTQLPVMRLPDGELPQARGHSLVHDTGAMAVLLASLFFLVVSYRNGYKYIENLFHNMFSVRRRESLFEDYTVKETQILSALIGLTCTTEAIMMYQGISLLHPQLRGALQGGASLHIVLFVGIAVAFYLLQLMGYHLLGYVFSDKESTKVWIDGFKASQSLLGLLLFPVVALSLAVSESVKISLILAVILYFCMRFAFICKGFRIFYSNLLSLVYFILYLCSVEIVPLAVIYGLTVTVCRYLQS